MYRRLYQSEIKIKTEYAKKEVDIIQARDKIKDFLEEKGERIVRIEDRAGIEHLLYSIEGITAILARPGWLSGSPMSLKLYSDQKSVEDLSKRITSLSDVLEIKDLI